MIMRTLQYEWKSRYFSIFAEDNVYYLKKIDGKPGFLRGKYVLTLL